MREIKFRAWLTDEKRMAFGYPDLSNQHFYESKDSKYPTLGTDFRVAEIMQFTGLKDLNSQDIYEGDVVKMDDGTFWQVIWFAMQAQFTLASTSINQIPGSITSSGIPMRHFQWLHAKKDSGFYVKGYDRESRKEIGFEVIGNIYENSELLK